MLSDLRHQFTRSVREPNCSILSRLLNIRLSSLCGDIYMIMAWLQDAKSRTLFNNSFFNFLSAAFNMRASSCDELLAETFSGHD